LIAAALAASLSAHLAALPQGEARYRFELGGERIGTAELRIRCDGPRCAVRWSVSTRSPEAAGGAIHSRRVEVETDAEGRWVDGAVTIHDDGVPTPGRGVWGAVPAALAEVVLARAREESEPCIEIFDERSGARAKACGRRGPGATWDLDVAGEAERVRVGVGGLPAEVLLPGQGARYVADPRAEVPLQPPRLYGERVPGPESPAEARRFCGAPVDPAPPVPKRGRLPPPAAEGASCREKTARWLAAAARAGIEGRTAVGVAWDGSAFSWHAWAEARVDGAWIPVDPSFGQLPARGPRFTLARYADGDPEARDAAGRRILGCWGRGRIE
jgi:hypothetical protein